MVFAHSQKRSWYLIIRSLSGRKIVKMEKLSNLYLNSSSGYGYLNRDFAVNNTLFYQKVPWVCLCCLNFLVKCVTFSTVSKRHSVKDNHSYHTYNHDSPIFKPIPMCFHTLTAYFWWYLCFCDVKQWTYCSHHSHLDLQVPQMDKPWLAIFYWSLLLWGY